MVLSEGWWCRLTAIQNVAQVCVRTCFRDCKPDNFSTNLVSVVVTFHCYNYAWEGMFFLLNIMDQLMSTFSQKLQ